MHLYSNNRLSYIASAVRRPLYMEKTTTNQTLLHDFASICIEVNIDYEISNVLHVDGSLKFT